MPPALHRQSAGAQGGYLGSCSLAQGAPASQARAPCCSGRWHNPIGHAHDPLGSAFQGGERLGPAAARTHGNAAVPVPGLPCGGPCPCRPGSAICS